MQVRRLLVPLVPLAQRGPWLDWRCWLLALQLVRRRMQLQLRTALVRQLRVLPLARWALLKTQPLLQLQA